MAFFDIVYEWDDREAQAWFEYAGYRTRRASEPLQRAGRELLKDVRRTFESEGAYIGELWEDLSEDYKEHKEAEWGHVYPILVASGRLYDAATSERSLHTRSSADGGLLEYTVNVPYAAYHQQPDGPGTGRMPRRPFYELTPDLVARIDTIFLDWLDDLRHANARRVGDALNPFGGIG